MEELESVGVRTRVTWWLLLEGNRQAVAGGVVLLGFVLFAGFVRAGVVVVDGSSVVDTLLASGVTSGLLTLITVALTINQLLLSRVFGSPGELGDRLDETLDYRSRIEELADVPTSPNDPVAFLGLIGEALDDHLSALDGEHQGYPADARQRLESYRDGLGSYADLLSAVDPDAEGMIESYPLLLGAEYADFLTATREIRNRHGAAFTEDHSSALESIQDLLEGVAILRQFYKTTTIQQELARLSRLIAYSGVVGVLTAYSLALAYTSPAGTTIHPAWRPWVVPLGLAVTLSPLALLISYTLRIATISRYTVSVGPFSPPEERFGE